MIVFLLILLFYLWFLRDKIDNTRVTILRVDLYFTSLIKRWLIIFVCLSLRVGTRYWRFWMQKSNIFGLSLALTTNILLFKYENIVRFDIRLTVIVCLSFLITFHVFDQGIIRMKALMQNLEGLDRKILKVIFLVVISKKFGVNLSV
jgi:hypothetical protein